MKVIFYELAKLWRKKAFVLGALAIILANLLLLFVYGQVTPNRNAEAYKKMTAQLGGFSMEEKQVFVDELYRRIDGLYMIDQIMRLEEHGRTPYSQALREENAWAFKELMPLYYSGNYVQYTDNLYEEHSFLGQIREELDTVMGYDEYLENIQVRAGEFSQISIFKTESGDSFSEKSIRAQAKAYEHLEGIETDYLPEEGIMSALEFRLSDVLLIAFVLLMSSVLLREEKDSGMLALNFSLPGGRAKTAVAKLLAVYISLSVVVVVLYGMNLAYYGNIYGMGSLNRAIQSLPSLIQCTWQLSIWQYIFVFLAAKWLSAVIIGSWLMLCTYLAKNIYIGWGIGLAFIGLNFLVREMVSGIGHFNLFRYMNIFSFMNTNELLGTYIQLYFFGDPLPILWAECVGGLLYLLVFCLLFVWVYTKGLAVFSTGRQFVLVTGARRIRHLQEDVLATGKMGWLQRCRAKSIFRRGCPAARMARHEMYKIFRLNGAVVVFGAFLMFLIFQVTQHSSYMSLDEEIYKDYMVRWGGRVTSQTVGQINKENERFQPLYELEDALMTGQLSSQDYQNALLGYTRLRQEKGAFDKVVLGKLNYLEQHPGAWLVYERGYEKLFDIGHEKDLYEMMILFLALILGLGSCFSMEKITEMETVLAVTPLGRRQVALAKTAICLKSAGILAAVSLIPRYIVVGLTYGFEQWMAPACSLEMFSAVPGWMTIYHMILLQLLFRILTAWCAVCVILFLSGRMKNSLTVFFAAALLLELCPILYLCGVDSLLWISMWPVFHFPSVLADDVPVTLLAMYGILFAGAAVAARDDAVQRFGRPLAGRRPAAKRGRY